MERLDKYYQFTFMHFVDGQVPEIKVGFQKSPSFDRNAAKNWAKTHVVKNGAAIIKIHEIVEISKELFEKGIGE